MKKLIIAINILFLITPVLLTARNRPRNWRRTRRRIIKQETQIINALKKQYNSSQEIISAIINQINSQKNNKRKQTICINALVIMLNSDKVEWKLINEFVKKQKRDVLILLLKRLAKDYILLPVTIIKTLLNKEDTEITINTINMLAMYDANEQIWKTINPFFKTKNNRIKMALINVIGIFPEEKAFPILKEFLKSKNIKIKKAVINKMTELVEIFQNSKNIEEFLVNYYYKTKDTDVKRTIIKNIFSVNKEVFLLLKTAVKSKDSKLREYALKKLKYFTKWKKCFEIVKLRLDDDNTRVKLQAIETIMAFDDKQAIRKILQKTYYDSSTTTSLKLTILKNMFNIDIKTATDMLFDYISREKLTQRNLAVRETRSIFINMDTDTLIKFLKEIKPRLRERTINRALLNNIYSYIFRKHDRRLLSILADIFEFISNRGKINTANILREYPTLIETEKIVIKMLNDTDERIRRIGMFNVNNILRKRTSERLINNLFQIARFDLSEDIRSRAVDALARVKLNEFQKKKLIAILLNILEKGGRNEKFNAIKAISMFASNIQNTQQEKVVVKAMLPYLNIKIRKRHIYENMAINLFLKLSKKIEKYLYDVYTTTDDIGQKYTLLAFFGRRYNESFLPMFKEAFNSNNKSFKCKVISIMAGINNKEITEMVKTAFKDTDSDIKLSVLISLLKYDKADIDLLINSLDDKAIRIMAIIGLGLIEENNDAIYYLEKYSNSSNKKERAAVAWALGKIHNEKAINILERLYNDEESIVKIEAWASLKECGIIKNNPIQFRNNRGQIVRRRIERKKRLYIKSEFIPIKISHPIRNTFKYKEKLLEASRWEDLIDTYSKLLKESDANEEGVVFEKNENVYVGIKNQISREIENLPKKPYEIYINKIQWEAVKAYNTANLYNERAKYLEVVNNYPATKWEKLSWCKLSQLNYDEGDIKYAKNQYIQGNNIIKLNMATRTPNLSLKSIYTYKLLKNIDYMMLRRKIPSYLLNNKQISFLLNSSYNRYTKATPVLMFNNGCVVKFGDFVKEIKQSGLEKTIYRVKRETLVNDDIYTLFIGNGNTLSAVDKKTGEKLWEQVVNVSNEIDGKFIQSKITSIINYEDTVSVILMIEERGQYRRKNVWLMQYDKVTGKRKNILLLGVLKTNLNNPVQLFYDGIRMYVLIVNKTLCAINQSCEIDWILNIDEKVVNDNNRYNTFGLKLNMFGYKNKLFLLLPLNDANILICIDSDTGEKIWSKHINGIKTQLITAVNGLVYISKGNTIIAFDVNNGEQLWKFSMPDNKEISGLAAYGKGSIFIPTEDSIYIIDTDNKKRKHIIPIQKANWKWNLYCNGNSLYAFNLRRLIKYKLTE